MSIITLVGMMGCGKSTVGKKLSTKLNKNFFDTDTIINSTSPIKDIFANHGESNFREIEYNIIHQLLSTTNDCIIATGGGAFIENKTRQLLMQKTTTIWLKVSLETILSRIKQDITRPLSSLLNKDFFDFRNSIYQKSLIHISCDHLNPTEIADIIAGHIK